jgi:DNA polymerase III subunit gamma/tau
MSHQVLARKWRPREFASLVGQEHVVRALTHALDTNRLHHAYLFTGTRGVGKTTIARILAKSVNCETGITSRPCGQCRACNEIDQGRFPDYLEMDAASNRGVEEMAQLLENAVYAPVSGRYKVYMIDEVHMLTAHAFNAMLKTLEEPPGHVIFILATTDPQKVPVTVLSRCLQFNLKNVPAPAIADHLARVLEAETVAFERNALSQIGRAASGSMRDALSLLDQAIAYGGGRVDETPVREMLGVVDRHDLERILDALVGGDGPALVGVADDMLTANAPFGQVLLDLAALLQRIALRQIGVALPDADDPEMLERLAGSISAEDLQVYYQIAIHGARDLPLAPDPHAGFTMTLLRLLAFRPASGAPPPVAGATAPLKATPLPRPASAGSRASPGAAALAAATAGAAARSGGASAALRPAARAAASTLAPAGEADPAPNRPVAPGGFDGDWAGLAASLPQSGMLGQFMHQSELLGHDGNHLRLRVPIRQLAEQGIVAKVRDALSRQLGESVRLSVEVGMVQGATAAAARSQQQADLQAQAQATIEGDAFVRTLLNEFDGTILPESVRPISSTGETE